MDKILEQELWESLLEAEKLGILHWEQVAIYWYDKALGMRWLNTIPQCNGTDNCYICQLEAV